MLCSDRGREYYRRHTPYRKIFGPFVKFLEENDIVAQYSLPCELQQNGVAERRNRTLMDMVCSMLSGSCTPGHRLRPKNLDMTCSLQRQTVEEPFTSYQT
jgi:hypothetical protein